MLKSEILDVALSDWSDYYIILCWPESKRAYTSYYGYLLLCKLLCPRFSIFIQVTTAHQ